MATSAIRNTLPRQLIGRMAAVLTVLGGVMAAFAEVASGHWDNDRIVTTAIAVAVGVALWFLPWERWGHRGTLLFMTGSLIALFVGQVDSADPVGHPEEVPVFLVTLFAWNGLAHDRWTSVKFALPSLAAYVGPGLLDPAQSPDLFGILFTIPLATLVGEAVAWVTAKLTTAESERLLNKQRIDFLSSAQHEIRTPVTSIAGYIRLLKTRHKLMTQEQIDEAFKAMARASDRLERLAEGLADAEDGRDPDSRADLGLLAPHYEDGEVDLSDPQRGGTP